MLWRRRGERRGLRSVVAADVRAVSPTAVVLSHPVRSSPSTPPASRQRLPSTRRSWLHHAEEFSRTNAACSALVQFYSAATAPCGSLIYSHTHDINFLPNRVQHSQILSFPEDFRRPVSVLTEIADLSAVQRRQRAASVIVNNGNEHVDVVKTSDVRRSVCSD